MAASIGDFIGDESLLEHIKSKGFPVIMITGGPDSGKTTLVELLADLLSEVAEVALLDLDMGQSHLGPPTTIAWGRLKGGFKGWEKIKTEDFYFTGATSPPGNLLPSLAGAKKMLEKAREKCPRVIIDTTGLTGEPLGRIYKQYKIDLLRPDMVIGLERAAGELGPILGPFMKLEKPVVHLVRTPKAARLKSIAKRTEHRAGSYREYFSRSMTLELDLRETGVRFLGDPPLREGIAGRLVSLRDAMNEDVALGVIEHMDLKRGKAFVNTPVKEGTEVKVIVVGKAEVEL